MSMIYMCEGVHCGSYVETDLTEGEHRGSVDGRERDPGGARCAFLVVRYCGMSYCVGELHGSYLANMMISINRKQHIVVARGIKKRRARAGL